MKTLQVETYVLSQEKREAGIIWLLYYAYRVACKNYWSLIPLVTWLYSYGMDWLMRSTLQMNSLVIRYTRYSRTWGLFWDEIEKIGVDPHGSTVFYTNDKTYIVWSLQVFKGKDKEALLELYNHQIAMRGIPVEQLTKEEFEAAMQCHIERGMYKRIEAS